MSRSRSKRIRETNDHARSMSTNSEENLQRALAEIDKKLADFDAGRSLPPFVTPKVTDPTPPTFTDPELRCIAWAFGAMAWVPSAWRESTDSVAKKLRAYLGDEAVDEKVRP